MQDSNASQYHLFRRTRERRYKNVIMKKISIAGTMLILSCADEQPPKYIDAPVRDGEIITHYARTTQEGRLELEPEARTNIDYCTRAVEQRIGRALRTEELSVLYDYINTKSGDNTSLDRITNEESLEYGPERLTQEKLSNIVRMITGQIEEQEQTGFLPHTTPSPIIEYLPGRVLCMGEEYTADEAAIERLMTEIDQDIIEERSLGQRLINGQRRRMGLTRQDQMSVLRAMDTNDDSDISEEDIQYFSQRYQELREAMEEYDIGVGDMLGRQRGVSGLEMYMRREGEPARLVEEIVRTLER